MEILVFLVANPPKKNFNFLEKNRQIFETKQLKKIKIK